MNIRIIAAFLFLTAPWFSSASDLPGLVLTKDGGCNSNDASGCPIWVAGPIDQQMADNFERMLARLRSTYDKLIYIYLNSEGGDVSSAQKMGASLRKDRNHAVFVARGQKCLSACVFVLAGGIQRVVEGQVGIHRPYYEQVESLDAAVRQQRYRQLLSSSRSYLARMNIRDTLVDDMVAVPPERMKILSQAELSQYGLNRSDPVFDEEMDDLIARRYGLSKSEYLRRRSLAEKQCAGVRVTDESECVLSIMSR